MRLSRLPSRPCIFCEIAASPWLHTRVFARGTGQFSTSSTQQRQKSGHSTPVRDALRNPGKFWSMNRDGGGLGRGKPGNPRNKMMPMKVKDEIRRKTVEDPRALSFMIRARLDDLKEEVATSKLLEKMGVEVPLNRLWTQFCLDTFPNMYLKGLTTAQRSEQTPIVKELKEILKYQGELHFNLKLKTKFLDSVLSKEFSKSQIEKQIQNANLQHPHEWYPGTRAIQRHIHLHIGPTNSGKTYNALKRLEEAETGIYAGPLRLLAHEVYTRMNAAGRGCALVTGEERRAAPEGRKTDLASCTVEMVPLNTPLDVAVIDEIQMIGDNNRGWAWTQALMGVHAKEVHLCGEDRTASLIQELVGAMGDKLTIHRYERLSPLQVAPESMKGKLDNLQKGDAVVSFSVMGIHALRKQIETATGKKAAMVYGSLPPETRAAQARLFNDPNNDHDFLVCSDAVGMGLNLSIKRVIFEATWKFDGQLFRPLAIPDLKQIGGRAGRFRTSFQATDAAQSATAAANVTNSANTSSTEEAPPTDSKATSATPANSSVPSVGLVTTLEEMDYAYMAEAMTSSPPPLTAAGIYPPDHIIMRFSQYFPSGTPFSYVLNRLHDICTLNPRYELCDLKDLVLMSDAIQDVDGLTVLDRLVFAAAPASVRDPEEKAYIRHLAQKVANYESCGLLDSPLLVVEILDREPRGDRDHLKSLERLHRQIVTYLWLSYRFTGVFNQRSLAFHTKELVEAAIEHVLTKFNYADRAATKKFRDHKKEKMQKMLQEKFQEGAEITGISHLSTNDSVMRINGRSRLEQSDGKRVDVGTYEMPEIEEEALEEDVEEGDHEAIVEVQAPDSEIEVLEHAEHDNFREAADEDSTTAQPLESPPSSSAPPTTESAIPPPSTEKPEGGEPAPLS